jgi:hypothetical protein
MNYSLSTIADLMPGLLSDRVGEFMKILAISLSLFAAGTGSAQAASYILIFANQTQSTVAFMDVGVSKTGKRGLTPVRVDTIYNGEEFVNGVKYHSVVYQANCKTRQMAVDDVRNYDEQHNLIWNHPAGGNYNFVDFPEGDAAFEIACGAPVSPYASKIYIAKDMFALGEGVDASFNKRQY